MRIYTNNYDRTFKECDDMYEWMVDTFGNPTDNHRWTYGKELNSSSFSERVSGVWDIHYFEFSFEEDASLFALRWL